MTTAWIAGFLLLGAVLLLVAVFRLRKQRRRLGRILTAHQRQHRAVLEFLHYVGERIRTHLALDDTLDSILAFLVESSRAKAGAVFLRDEGEPDFLQARVVQGIFPPLQPVPDKMFARKQYLAEKVKKERVRLGEGIVGRVAQEAKPLLIADARYDPSVPPSANEVVPIETLMATPLLARGQVLGVIVLINRLSEGSPFTQEDLELLVTLADQAAINVNLVQVYRKLEEKQRIEQELRVAHDFQKMLLPRAFPSIPGLEVAALSEPAQEIGGDYYDFFDVDENRLGIVIADVAGKGIPGALVMATVRSTVRAEARGDPSPRSVLVRVNRQLVQDTSPNIFVTMTYAVLDRRNLRLRFARAGHEPFVVCGEDGRDQPRLYTPNGIALGLVSDETFNVTEEKEIELHEGEAAVLYTDGVVEARNPAGEEYGAERFLETLRVHAGQSASELIDTVTRDVGMFTRGHTQHDDLTLVVLKADKNAGEEASTADAQATGAG